ncbi:MULTISPECIES: hypothetical protein [unclassified Leifsonia]|uniref:hypothetical protein n=1 Tax=unclassified Leifsonia TaxID=2663824 RepID=UPI0006F924ED|nr:MULTISPECIES: hypothetical protein [unclassified Leifsonia]KQX07244.1 hypothetical protein ASC59_05485 [Leifsonia sp. Root1293]KRA11527.1 hypothetical protein ASD61_05485 [Leifsonia sp. Root60]
MARSRSSSIRRSTVVATVVLSLLGSLAVSLPAQADDAPVAKSISGRVTLSGKQPYAGACPQAWLDVEGEWQDSGLEATVTDTGDYVFAGVDDGRYTISAAPCSESEPFLPTWHPSLEAAPAVDSTDVVVVAGVSVTGIDIALRAPALTATTAPVVTGTARVGGRLDVSTGTWNVDGLTFSYNWLRGGLSLISDAHGSSYVPVADDAGAPITAVVVASRVGFKSAIASAPAGTIEQGVFEFVPVISGTVAVGSTLTATAPVGPAYGYQWNRAGVAVSGAVAATYTVSAGDVGSALSVTVVATQTGYTPASLTSAATAVVPSGAIPAFTPTVTGTAVVGSTLTAAAPVGWSYGYQWKRNGVLISTAKAKNYTLVAADVGKKLSVAVTASRTGYTARTESSPSTATVLNKLVTTPTPTISGVRAVGGRLTVAAGSWKPAPVTLSYVWKRNGVAIAKATGTSYVLTAADRGAAISVSVVGRKSGFASVTKTSTSTGAIATGVIAFSAKLTGTQHVGNSIGVSITGVKPSGTTVKYQWYRDGVAISGATSASRALKNIDAGTTISVRVTASKSAWIATSQTLKTSAITRSAVTTKTGWLRVGIDIKAGTYFTGNTADCQWIRTWDGSGQQYSFLGWDRGAGRRMVTVLASDAYLYTKGCGAWYKWDGTATMKTKLGPGVWVSGVDFKLGVYEAKALPGEHCRVSAASALTGTESDYFGGADYGTKGPYRWRAMADEKYWWTDGCTTWKYVSP